MRRRFSTLLGFLGLCFLVVTTAAFAAPEDGFIKVRAEAEAHGTGLTARDKAVQKAQHQVIAGVLEATLVPIHLAGTEILVNDAEKYIRSTQVLRHEVLDSTTRLEIECFVNRKQLIKEAAKTLLPSLTETPTVLLVIVEASEPTHPHPSPAEEALAAALRKKGLSIADSAEVWTRYSASALLEKLRGDIDVAGRFAQEHLADVVVLGESVSEPAPSDRSGNISTNTAEVALRVFRASDGKIIDTIGREARVYSVDQAEGIIWAVKDACGKLVEDLFVSVVLGVLSAYESGDLLITIEEPGSRDRVEEVIRILSGFAGVGRVEELFYDDALARLRLQYAGAIAPLVDAITTRSYGGKTIEARRVVQRRMDLVFNQ